MATRIARRTSLELEHSLKKAVPRYFEAILNHPPAPSLTQATVQRPAQDLPTSTRDQRQPKRRKLQPQPIVWEDEDRVRMQFYKDHPWERARAKVVTELDMVGAGWAGKRKGDSEWTELQQRSKHPTPDDAVEYIMQLHEVLEMPLKNAYQSGVAQFRALRASHEQATKFAQLEAVHYGAEFSNFGHIAANVEAENRALKKWVQKDAKTATENASQAANRLLEPMWDKRQLSESFTEGKRYLDNLAGAKELEGPSAASLPRSPTSSRLTTADLKAAAQLMPAKS